MGRSARWHTEEGRAALARDGNVEDLQATRQELQLRVTAQDVSFWSLVRAVEALRRSHGRRREG